MNKTPMLQRIWHKIRGGKRNGRMRPLQPELLAQMTRMVAATRPDEIGCDECFEQIDRFAELYLAGKNAAEAMPLVQDHLNRCGDCLEEFEALLTALQKVSPRW